MSPRHINWKARTGAKRIYIHSLNRNENGGQRTDWYFFFFFFFFFFFCSLDTNRVLLLAAEPQRWCLWRMSFVSIVPLVRRRGSDVVSRVSRSSSTPRMCAFNAVAPATNLGLLALTLWGRRLAMLTFMLFVEIRLGVQEYRNFFFFMFLPVRLHKSNAWRPRNTELNRYGRGVHASAGTALMILDGASYISCHRLRISHSRCFPSPSVDLL